MGNGRSRPWYRATRLQAYQAKSSPSPSSDRCAKSAAWGPRSGDEGEDNEGDDEGDSDEAVEKGTGATLLSTEALLER